MNLAHKFESSRVRQDTKHTLACQANHDERLHIPMSTVTTASQKGTSSDAEPYGPESVYHCTGSPVWFFVSAGDSWKRLQPSGIADAAATFFFLVLPATRCSFVGVGCPPKPSRAWIHGLPSFNRKRVYRDWCATFEVDAVATENRPLQFSTDKGQSFNSPPEAPSKYNNVLPRRIVHRQIPRAGYLGHE
jgi:hypothetical protein